MVFFHSLVLQSISFSNPIFQRLVLNRVQKMAWNKIATVFVLDVGSHMKEAGDGKQTALEVSVKCITQMLQNKLFTESKDEFALVLFGTEETENRLNEINEERYDSIKTVSELKLPDWDVLDVIHNLEPTESQGDVFEAVKVGLDILSQDAAASKRKRFAQRRLLCFSNLNGAVSATISHLDSFAKDIQSNDVDVFQLIGRDLGSIQDSSHHIKALPKHSKKTESAVKLMDHLFEKLISMKMMEEKESYSFSEALSFTQSLITRQVRPTPWKGLLEIGTTLKIPVVGFSKVKPAAPKQNWKKAYAQDPSVNIIQSTEYFVQSGLQRDQVPEDEIIDAYRYGTTLVPFTIEDKMSMKFTGVGKCLRALGFAHAAQVKAHLYVGTDVKIFTAPPGDEAACTAMSALVRGMDEEKCVIIARFGYNAISAPKMVSLSPHISPSKNGKYDRTFFVLFGRAFSLLDHCIVADKNVVARYKRKYMQINIGQGLYFHYLPFLDDLRLFTFANLKSSELKSHLQPNDEQLDAVESLVDMLTLTEKDGDFETVSPRNIQNPHLSRLYHALQFRASNPNGPLPDPDPLLMAKMGTPVGLAKKAKGSLEKVKTLFPLKKVEQERKFVKEGIFADAAHEEDDGEVVETDATPTAVQITDYKKDSVTTIGTISPAEDFQVMILDADASKFSQAFKKAVDVVNQLIFKTFEGSAYSDKVLHLVSAMRTESIKRSDPEKLNDFLQSFKDQLLQRNLATVWDRLVKKKLTLITKEEVKSSSVSRKEADEFLQHSKSNKVETKKDNAPPAEDDMFSEMFS